eukprot:SAG11_NODE_8210_length_1046_cov_1.501584_2_plen_116_part_00
MAAKGPLLFGLVLLLGVAYVHPQIFGLNHAIDSRDRRRCAGGEVLAMLGAGARACGAEPPWPGILGCSGLLYVADCVFRCEARTPALVASIVNPPNAASNCNRQMLATGIRTLVS